jgi:hypothetical protein
MIDKNSQVISKFNFKAYLNPVIIILFISFPVIVNTLIINKNDDPNEKLIFTSIMPLIVIIIGIYQLRQNLLNIIITDENITFRRYLGFGKSNIYNLNDLDGYNIQIKKTKGEEYEILKIIKDNKTLMQISQFYIDNYSDLKLKIGQKLKIVNK